MYHAPCTGLDGPGCSEYAAGATTHDTCGSLPARMSSLKAPRKPPSGIVLAMPLYSGLRTSSLAGSYAGETTLSLLLTGLPDASFARRYCLKPASALSVKLSGMFW